MKIAKRQRGVSLVEALVALVVMSIGMLGIAALYIESVKANRSALLRTQAVTLANDMADRIRANRLAGNSYALAMGAAPPAAHNCVSGVNCLEDDLAEDDVNRWVTSVRSATGMPWNGATPPQTAVIFTPAIGVGLPDTYAIVITWREPNQDPAEADYRYQLNMQLIPTAPT
jgi:type IV pilus assembly protein PilV